MQKVYQNACVYIIVGPDGRFYIGQTTRLLRDRWRQHIYSSNAETKRNSQYITRAIFKHGIENFSIHSLLNFPMTKEELDSYESAIITILGANVSGIGFNLALGNNNPFGKFPSKRRGYKLSVEHKAKIGRASTGRICRPETKEKIGAANRGKKHGPLSEATKKKISEQKIGIPKSPETRARMRVAQRGHRGIVLSAKHKAILMATNNTPEARAKRSMSAKLSWASGSRRAAEIAKVGMA